MFDCRGSGSFFTVDYALRLTKTSHKNNHFLLVGRWGGLFLTAVAVLVSALTARLFGERPARVTYRDTPDLQITFGVIAFPSGSAWL